MHASYLLYMEFATMTNDFLPRLLLSLQTSYKPRLETPSSLSLSLEPQSSLRLNLKIMILHSFLDSGVASDEPKLCHVPLSGVAELTLSYL